MNWRSERDYEVWRAVTLAFFMAYIGVYLLNLERADIPVSFVSGAAAALCGFLLIGTAYRPQTLTLAGIVLRYGCFSILYAAGLLILYYRVAVPIWAPLFMIACLFFGREARARMIAGHRS
jgi:hypothetical protein